MKVLDVQHLFTSVEFTISEIGKVQNQLTNVLKAVDELVSLEGAMDGKGGKAIRAFFAESHFPFLKYFFDLLEEYKQSLEGLKKSVHTFEPQNNGHLKQTFLESHLENGLNAAKNVTNDLTAEANSIISSVSDIVSLTPLNSADFNLQTQIGKKKLTDTIEELYELDQSQSNLLSSIQYESLTAKNYISGIQSKFKSGEIVISEYDGEALQDIESYHHIIEKQLKTEEEIMNESLVSIDPKVAIDSRGDWIGYGTNAVAFYQIYDKVNKGFKIEKYMTKGGITKYRVYKPELIGMKPPKNGRTTKIFEQDFVRKHGKNIKVTPYVTPGAGAISALKSKAGWLGVAVTTYDNAKSNIEKGESFTNIAVDAGVDVGLGAVSLAVGGAVTAAVIGTVGAPVLVGVAVGVVASTVFTSILDGIKIKDKSISDHIKGGFRTIAGWFKN